DLHRQPYARNGQRNGEHQGHEIDDHAVAIIVVAVAAFVFCEASRRRGRWWLLPAPSLRRALPRPKRHHPPVVFGRFGTVGGHDRAVSRYRNSKTSRFVSARRYSYRRVGTRFQAQPSNGCRAALRRTDACTGPAKILLATSKVPCEPPALALNLWEIYGKDGRLCLVFSEKPDKKPPKAREGGR